MQKLILDGIQFRVEAFHLQNWEKQMLGKIFSISLESGLETVAGMAAGISLVWEDGSEHF